MWTSKVVGSSAAREPLRLHNFPGVRSRTPPWKPGVSSPPASAVAAELLRGVVRGALSEEPARPGSLSELLVERGWSRLSILLTPASMSVVLQCEPEASRVRLTLREAQVAGLMAQGLKSGQAGAALSIAAATARGATDRALGKLGLSSTVQLVLLWHALQRGHRRYVDAQATEWLLFRASFESSPWQGLTVTQRQVVLGLMSGERTLEIAERRSVSARTISNQVAALLKRFGASSRGELIFRLLEPTR